MHMKRRKKVVVKRAAAAALFWGSGGLRRPCLAAEFAFQLVKCRFDNDELQNQEEAKEERICLGESQLRGRMGKSL